MPSDDDDPVDEGGDDEQTAAANTSGARAGPLLALMPQSPSLTVPSLAHDEELSAVAHAVNHCCAGGGGDFFLEDEPGVRQVRMEP